MLTCASFNREAEVEIEAWDGRLEAKQAGEQYAPPSPKRKSNAKGKGKNSKGKNKKKNKTCSKEDSNDESDDDISDTDEEEDSNFAVLTDEEEAEETPKKKRKTSGSDSEADSDVQIEEDSDDDENEEDISNDMTEDEIKSTLKEKKAVAKESRKKKKDRKAETDRFFFSAIVLLFFTADTPSFAGATAAVTRIDKKLAKLQKEKYRMCALARNHTCLLELCERSRSPHGTLGYSRAALAEDFRSGLRVMDDEVSSSICLPFE